MEGYGVEHLEDCADYFVLHVRRPV
jgi:hypothetical protein